jgi:hypothetical protein
VENGSFLENEGSFLGSVYFRPGHIRWEQIWSKLDSMKIPFNRFSQHLHGTGFCQSRRSFNKEMPVSEQSQEQTLNQHMLAQNVLFQPFT